jgi:hypothetical protein
MSVDMTSKQLNFVSEFTRVVVSLLTDNDTLASLKENWTNNGFASGAEPPENNITDEILSQSAFKYMTADELNLAMGGVASVMQAVTTNRGYLEPMRP